MAERYKAFKMRTPDDGFGRRGAFRGGRKRDEGTGWC